MPKNNSDIVLVTGGAGYLGQHIVKHLLNDSSVKEIRILDTKRLADNQITTEERPSDSKLVTSVVGDVRKLADILAVMPGCTAVIHCAAVVDFRLFPDTASMYDVNVKGTESVIQACIQCGVSRLVFTSSIDVAVSNRDIVNGDESMRLPERCLMHEYGYSKQQAEALVLNANGKSLDQGDGEVLRTLILRPSVMYGEGDRYFIPTILETASKTGFLTPVGSGRAMSQYAYVGNVAWAHVCALRALADRDARSVAGRTYFINDNTPLMNSFDFAGLVLPKCGLSVAKFRVPFWLAFGIMVAVQCVAGVLRFVLSSVNLNATLGAVIYTNRTIYFSRSLAEERLGYAPKYDFATSLERSLDFYVRTFAKR